MAYNGADFDKRLNIEAVIGLCCGFGLLAGGLAMHDAIQDFGEHAILAVVSGIILLIVTIGLTAFGLVDIDGAFGSSTLRFVAAMTLASGVDAFQIPIPFLSHVVLGGALYRLMDLSFVDFIAIWIASVGATILTAIVLAGA